MKPIWIGERTRPRVLVAAPRRNELPRALRFYLEQGFDTSGSTEKFRDGEGAITRTRRVCAPRISAVKIR
jgi:hypothetical protein